MTLPVDVEFVDRFFRLQKASATITYSTHY